MLIDLLTVSNLRIKTDKLNKYGNFLHSFLRKTQCYFRCFTSNTIVQRAQERIKENRKILSTGCVGIAERSGEKINYWDKFRLKSQIKRIKVAENSQII